MYCSVIWYGNFKCGKNTELLVRVKINDLSEKHWNSLNRIRWLINERTEKRNNRCISQWQRRNRNLTVFLSFLSCLVCLDKVIEVRCGQQTKNFVKFPYTEVESQSFSLMFEKQQGLYAMLLTLYSLSHL